MTDFVSGEVSTVTDLGKDEAWLQEWLKEQPDRLGLGDLEAAESASDDDRSFLATDDNRCFSVDVQLGEMEASRGFGVLDTWARNRVLHPDKNHVAVLVTETISDRYQTTLETLAEHLPLVVVELQVWKGDTEAIVVPHVALSSGDVDLSATPAAVAAEAVTKVDEAAKEAEVEAKEETEAKTEDTADAADAADVVTEAEAVAAEADAEAGAEADTGVGNPWGLPKPSGNGSTGLLNKVSN